MGMFDYLKVEMPFPDMPEGLPKGILFQTKDTPDQYMTTYTIKPDGRLTWRPYHYERVEKWERQYPDAPDDDFRSLIGSVRRVEAQEEDVLFDGDLAFYVLHDGVFHEFSAHFQENRVTAIGLAGARAITGLQETSP